jgi:hypothetical protein
VPRPAPNTANFISQLVEKSPEVVQCSIDSQPEPFSSPLSPQSASPQLKPVSPQPDSNLTNPQLKYPHTANFISQIIKRSSLNTEPETNGQPQLASLRENSKKRSLHVQPAANTKASRETKLLLVVSPARNPKTTIFISQLCNESSNNIQPSKNLQLKKAVPRPPPNTANYISTLVKMSPNAFQPAIETQPEPFSSPFSSPPNPRSNSPSPRPNPISSHSDSNLENVCSEPSNHIQSSNKPLPKPVSPPVNPKCRNHISQLCKRPLNDIQLKNASSNPNTTNFISEISDQKIKTPILAQILTS